MPWPTFETFFGSNCSSEKGKLNGVAHLLEPTVLFQVLASTSKCYRVQIRLVIYFAVKHKARQKIFSSFEAYSAAEHSSEKDKLNESPAPFELAFIFQMLASAVAHDFDW